jgi:hypothetical protein
MRRQEDGLALSLEEDLVAARGEQQMIPIDGTHEIEEQDLISRPRLELFSRIADEIVDIEQRLGGIALDDIRDLDAQQGGWSTIRIARFERADRSPEDRLGARLQIRQRLAGAASPMVHQVAIAKSRARDRGLLRDRRPRDPERRRVRALHRPLEPGRGLRPESARGKDGRCTEDKEPARAAPKTINCCVHAA